MQWYFKDETKVVAFLCRLHRLCCPVCGAVGAFVRHGFTRGYVASGCRGIRGWRIHCKRERGGCGRAPSIWLATSLLRRCFSTTQLWAFLSALVQAPSVKAAWERCGIRLTLDTGYRLFHRLRRCESVLRTRLCSRAPPPDVKGAGSRFLQMFTHLQEAFGDERAISTYQQVLQKDFLAIS